MRLVWNTALIDTVLAQWTQHTCDFSAVLRHPVFLDLTARACDFEQKTLTPEAYLHQLLHIDGIDMQKHCPEIERNLRCLQRIDLDAPIRDVARFLPPSLLPSIGDIPIYPVIGIAGLAHRHYIIIDPSPCPWFPADGSDAYAYVHTFILPTLRHEAHHVGYMHLHPDSPDPTPRTLRALAVDFARQVQMEGGAMLCQHLCNGRKLRDEERMHACRALESCSALLRSWLEQGDQPISPEAWTAYYALWGESQLAYGLGEALCLLLIEYGGARCVADCMCMEPLQLFHACAQSLGIALPCATS